MKALDISYTLMDCCLVPKNLLEGSGLETLTLNQQMVPQYLFILGEVEDFKKTTSSKLRIVLRKKMSPSEVSGIRMGD